jgi:plasmid stabilization system protein ParE
VMLNPRVGNPRNGDRGGGVFLKTSILHRRRAFGPRRPKGGETMPRGDKSKYTDKQERKADHIAESYEKRGVSEAEAERRAWATVNKDDAGGKKPGGSGRGKETGHPAAHRGGELGGKASASRPKVERSASAKKAAKTRKRHAEHRPHH